MSERLYTADEVEAFVGRAVAAEREKLKWDVHSCGPNCKQYACVAMREAVLAEREACARALDDAAEKSALQSRTNLLSEAASIVRARGEMK